jgi:FeS assembly SUF system protein
MNHQRTPLPLDDPAPSPEPANSPATPATPQPAAPLAEPLTEAQVNDLNERIVAALCTCFDPEIPVNIYELGLIYDILIAPSGEVVIRMTLTSPACPVAGTLPGEVERKLQTLPNITTVKVVTVWDPPWDKDRMSEAAKLQLGIDD